MGNQAIVGIDPKTHICQAVAMSTDIEARNEMTQQGLVIVEATLAQARKMLGEEVALPYAVAE